MFNLLISFLVLLGSYQFFRFSYSINGINRLVLNTPIEYFNVAIPLINKNEEIYLYFEQDRLEDSLNKYYEPLSKYSSEYLVTYYYYNLEDSSICTTNYCQGVEIRVNCKIDFDINFSRTMFYEIGERS